MVAYGEAPARLNIPANQLKHANNIPAEFQMLQLQITASAGSNHRLFDFLLFRRE